MSKASGAWGDKGSASLLATKRGKLEPSGGKKVHRKGKDEIVSTHLLLCMPVDLTGNDYAVIDGKAYEILSAEKPGDHMEIYVEGPK